MLKAIGKYIDTAPIRQILSQEEARMDVITIEVDRYYGEYDLTEFAFMMRGITESGGEAEAFLRKKFNDTLLRLEWEIGPAFTKEAGTLALDLIAYRYPVGADMATEEPDYLLRYQLPPIEVRALPDGTHALDEKSYTAFLLMVRKTAEEFRSLLYGDDSKIRQELTRISDVVDFHDSVIKDHMVTTGNHDQRISRLEAAMVPIIILTETKYRELAESKMLDDGTLYVVKDDEEEEGKTE